MIFDYDDGRVACGRDGIYIRDYYFPSRRTKKLSWQDIERFEQKPLGLLSGKLRLWGMGFSPVWFQLDLLRPLRTSVIILDTGSLIRTAITPKDPGKVFAILKQRLGSKLLSRTAEDSTS